MGSTATERRLFATVLLGVSSLWTQAAWAQATVSAQATAPDWYHLGNSLVNLSLADLSTGPIRRVWYSADGGTLYATTLSGKTFETKDFETWQASAAVAANPPDAPAGVRLPEPGAQIRGQYAFGSFVYRSQNLGASWDNLTAWRSRSIIGKPLDLAVSPRDSEEVTVASSGGVYRTLDAGKSWNGLNPGLPNFPPAGARLLSLPAGGRGVQLELEAGRVVEWQPGEKQAWVPTVTPAVSRVSPDEPKLRGDLQTQFGASVTALHREGAMIYAGLSDGRIAVSMDGVRWQPSQPVKGSGPVESLWVSPQDTWNALAVLGAGPGDPSSRDLPGHILRTLTAGNSWDDLTTADLAGVGVHGVTATVGASGGAMYVATDRGVFYTLNGPRVPSGIVLWRPLGGLPQAAATDVRLDAAGTQLWASVEGFGVYITAAPHRIGDPQVVSAADLAARPAAPGAAMIVSGAHVISAQTSGLAVSVLTAGDAESQIQIPFEARGDRLSLLVEAPSGPRIFQVPLESVSPAILVGPDGLPVLYDDTGTLLDAAHPARSRTRIQIMAAGLGRVKPEWTAGVDAPLDNPPAVVADVRAMLDGAPVDVTRAVLWHGYVGWYLVEIEIPKIVNSGPCELYLDVDGHASNPVRVYIEP